MKRKIILNISMIIVIAFFVLGIKSYAAEKYDFNIMNDSIPKEGMDYFNTNYQSLLNNIVTDPLMNNQNIRSTKSLSIGNPFMIYGNNGEADSTYYIPVLYRNKINYIFELVGTEEGYSLLLTQDMVEELNSINMAKNNFLLYEKDGHIVAESENKKEDILIPYIVESSKEDKGDEKFLTYNYQKKKQVIKKQMKNIQLEKTLESGKKEFRNYALGSRLTLYKPQGQYDYQMCWACTVANIVNYCNNVIVTGFDVCNRMGIGYNQKGNCYDIRNALKKFGVSGYKTIRNDELSWNEIKKNIDKKKPFAISTIGTKGNREYGHAMTGYGYNKNKVVSIWDSSGSSGKGKATSFIYGNGKCCLKKNGVSYYWKATVSRY